MSEESANQITIEMDHMIWDLPSKPSTPSIFKVDNYLRNDGREYIYDPCILAIGPYHHRKSSLQNMEQHKYTYLKQLLKHQNEQSVDKYVIAITKMEKRARECYSESLDLNENEFVKLMVLDGCFLIQLFRHYGYRSLRDVDDPIFKNEMMLRQLRHDIMLIENQLPFFVLNELFNMTKRVGVSGDDLIRLILYFFSGVFLDFSIPMNERCMHDIDHLFGLIHYNLYGNVGYRTCEDWENIHSISELREVGIRFEKAEVGARFEKAERSYSWIDIGIRFENTESRARFEKGERTWTLMDIKFVNGVLRIPRLNIFDETESQFKNLIAYEQYFTGGRPRYVTDYTFFMHCLIRTSDDVKLLRCHGIIGNWLGDDQDVCDMFKRLGKNILTSPRFISPKFIYSKIFNDVNEQCQQLKAMRNCFKSMCLMILCIIVVLFLILIVRQAKILRTMST